MLEYQSIAVTTRQSLIAHGFRDMKIELLTLMQEALEEKQFFEGFPVEEEDYEQQSQQ